MMCGCNQEMQDAQAVAQEALAEAVAEAKEKKPCGCEDKKVGNFGKARILANGDIEYPKKGSEPPPDIEGFERHGTNKWKFTKLWKNCKFRIQHPKIKPCGAIGMLTICNNPELPCRGKEVSFADCSMCPFQ